MVPVLAGHIMADTANGLESALVTYIILDHSFITIYTGPTAAPLITPSYFDVFALPQFLPLGLL